MKYILSLLVLCTAPVLHSSDYKTIKRSLFAACETNNSRSFEKYAKKAKKESIEPLFLRRRGKTLLHYAIERDAITICKYLLKKHKKQDLPTITLTTKGSNSPLHLAASKGNIELVNLLLEYDGFTTQKNKNGRTPIQRALLNKHVDVAEVILAYAVTQKPTVDITLSESAINEIIDRNINKGIVIPSDIIHVLSKHNKIAFC